MTTLVRIISKKSQRVVGKRKGIGRDELGKYEKTLMKELAKKYPHLGNLNQNNDHFGTSYFKKEPTGCGHRRIPKKKLE